APALRQRWGAAVRGAPLGRLHHRLHRRDVTGGAAGSEVVDGALAHCHHCGLPANAEFCCYGCELASRIAAEAREDHARLHGTLTFSLVLAMVVMMLALFLYAEDVFDAHGDIEMAWLRGAYRWASWILTTPVVVLCGGPLLVRALRARRLSMDALIGVGALAAYGLSVFALFARRRGIYFDSAATALVLATLGRYLEATPPSRAPRWAGPAGGGGVARAVWWRPPRSNPACAWKSSRSSWCRWISCSSWRAPRSISRC